jgi:hypothetical protein
MAAEKKTNSKTKEFTSEAGNKYTFQKVSPVAWLDIMDEVEAAQGKQRRTLYPKVLENIVVQPKMTLDDFEEYAELEEVVTAAVRFQRGK